jgi:putative endonuclease
VFCEVKARRGAGYGGAAIAVDAAKQERIRTLALAWLDDHGELDAEVRFDVITVEGTALEHYEAAF